MTASGILGHGGAAFPVGPQVGRDQAQRRPAALPVRQRRRGRARHLQGPLDPRERAAPAARVDADRRLRAAGAPRLRLHPRRVRPAVPPPGRARSRRPTPPATSASSILGTDFACDIVVYRGAGSYVCGEASALITSIEGKKRLPAQPPAAADGAGLYQSPTVINNVETLSNVAGIVAHGRRGVPQGRHAPRARARSWSRSPATSRGPASTRSSTATRWQKFLYEDCGGMLGGAQLKCIIPGGISTKVLTARRDRAADLRPRVARARPARRSARAA